MKLKITAALAALFASAGCIFAATNDITGLVQKGLFEEEARHNLDAAIGAYQAAIEGFDKDRQLSATAVFRLGECFRKLGKTNEANVQYERILREFTDQTNLVKLCSDYLGVASNPPVGSSASLLALPAAEDEEVRHIKEMIRNSPDLINGSGSARAMTPLQTAVYNGNVAAAELLLVNGADVNGAGTGGTPLGMAADKGNKAMIELLLAKGADVNAAAKGAGRFTPLHQAAAKGFKTVAEFLIARHANVNAGDIYGSTPLFGAAGNGFRAVVELLLANKADINARNSWGWTPLFRAVQNNQTEMAQLLLADKAEVNATTEHGVTPLLLAVSKPDIDIGLVKSLLASGADPEAHIQEDSHQYDGIDSGLRPVHLALRNERTDLLDLLLASHADVNGPYVEYRGGAKNSSTPLLMAASSSGAKPAEEVRILLEHGADPNLADEIGRTPLATAVINNNLKVVQELLDHHADANKPDNDGAPPLQFVCSGDIGAEIKALLLKAGANEDYQRLRGVYISQKGTGSIGVQVFHNFHRETDTLNHYTLLELIAEAYQSRGNGAVAFPDLAHVTIARLKPGGAKEEINVNLEEILKSADCSKDLSLEWGDIVQIGQLDHLVNEGWAGFSDEVRQNLANCLERKVEIIVKGQTTKIKLVSPIVSSFYTFNSFGGSGQWTTRMNLPTPRPNLMPGMPAPTPGLPRRPGISEPQDAQAGTTNTLVLSTFSLNAVVHQANVLLLSSDLTRVKVTRHGVDMQFNLDTTASGVSMPSMPALPGGIPRRIPNAANPSAPSDLWLRDGDVIEIPERDPNTK